MIVLVTFRLVKTVRSAAITIAIGLILSKGRFDTALTCSDVPFTLPEHAILELHIVEAVEEGEVASSEGRGVVGYVAARREFII